MFDKLEDLVRRYEEITNELTEPSVVNDQNRFRKLMKEQSDLQPLVTAYTEYKKCQETERFHAGERIRRGNAGDAEGRAFRGKEKNRGAGERTEDSPSSERPE